MRPHIKVCRGTRRESLGPAWARRALANGGVVQHCPPVGLLAPSPSWSLPELCRFWDADPPLFRRMVSLSAVDPEARQVIETREQWRYDGINTLVNRLADEKRLRAPFSADQSIATIAAVTSFPACDQIATTLGVSFIQLPELLLPLLGAVLDLKPSGPVERP